MTELPAPLVSTEVERRGEALSVGKRRYFNGRACPKGHVTLRDTLLAECCECRLEWRRKQKERDRARLKAAAVGATK